MTKREPIENDQVLPDEDAALDAPVTGALSLSELLDRMSQAFAGATVSRSVSAEILDFLAEENFLATNRRTSSFTDPQWKSAFVKILKYAFTHHRTPQMYALLAIWDEPLLDDIFFHQNQSQFAESIGITKAAVNNAMMDARKYFHTQPRRDQRTAESRAEMTAARIKKLEIIE